MGRSGKDRSLTDEWYGWLDRRDPARPFFGFLYYNAAVAVEPPDDYPPVAPVAPGASTQARRYARYLSAVHYVDSLVGRVLDDLERRKLLGSTVVLVTSDHGMEFDENGQGFTGHGTAYSDYQMHTPLVVGWPGRPPGRVARRTSHNDVAPTLVAGLFGCANPASDYASGHSRLWRGASGAEGRTASLRTRIAERLDQLPDPLPRQLRIVLELPVDLVLERIELRQRRRPRVLRWPRRAQRPPNRVAIATRAPGDLLDREPADEVHRRISAHCSTSTNDLLLARSTPEQARLQPHPDDHAPTPEG